MFKIVQKIVRSLKKEQNPSFKESMCTLSTQLALLSPPPSPKSVFEENWMVIDSQTQTACIINGQGDVEYTELSGGKQNDK